MCGICGWVGNDRVDREILMSMCQELHHRGPDAQQVEVINNVGLGHARLSIIDLNESANQPMANEDKSKWLVYNGEFYTFQSYREDLIKKGHLFVSHTDSEVLLHLYEEYGPAFVKELRGMFAFGIWDTDKEILMLCRDRVGIKPIYYYQKDGIFLFASELKSLLKHPSVDRELDLDAVNSYFMLGYIPRELCIYKNIRKLLPGHYLVYQDGKISIHRYWNLADFKVTSIKSEEQYLEELFELIDESVRLRLISDVPLGVFLSGGVDSSIVAAFMARHSAVPVKTFSIGFKEAKYNELKYARQVAKHIGSEHNEFIVGIDKAEAIEKLSFFYDEPFADSSAIPTYFVSKMSRKHVTVVLSGDGGDELFGGYNWYSWVLRQNKYNLIPQAGRQIISAMAGISSKNFAGKHFLKSLYYSEFETFLERTCFFFGDELSTLLPHVHNHASHNRYQAFYHEQGEKALERLTRTDFNYYLPDDIHTKVDRASMAVGLEARVPLLDHKICEFAFTVPGCIKMKQGSKKYLLKKIAKRLLPDDFELERKQGFSIPLKEWMLEDLGTMCMDLQHNCASRDVILNKNYVEVLYKEHKAGVRNNAQKLWAILCFNLWYKNNEL